MSKTKIVMLDDWENFFSSNLNYSDVAEQIELQIYTNHLVKQDLYQAIIDADVIILLRERTAVDADFIAHAPNLKHIICTGAQVRNMDTDAVKKAGISTSFAKGGDSKSTTCELAWTLILAAYKQLDSLRISAKQAEWRHSDFIPSSLKDKQLGLIGLGSIGQKVALVAQAFGMKVTCWSPNMTPARAAEHGVEAMSLDELMSSSDVISIHLVLGPTTQHLLNAQNLSLLKKNALLVNTSRAEIIDPEALVTALKTGQVPFYATDVYEEEPLPSEHPFYSLDNVLMTAHYGFVAKEVYRLFAENIRKEIKAYLT